MRHLHPVHDHEPVRVIDKLGPMLADGFGGVSAPVLESHYECRTCKQHLPKEESIEQGLPRPEQG